MTIRENSLAHWSAHAPSGVVISAWWSSRTPEDATQIPAFYALAFDDLAQVFGAGRRFTAGAHALRFLGCGCGFLLAGSGAASHGHDGGQGDHP